MNNQFSENLKKIRKDNNLSQEQLADSLGVSRQAISKWESGAAYPEMDKIIALCDKFNLNIDDLLHKDIKEVKGEDEAKKKLNRYTDDFLKYITDSVNLFSSMTFKSKVKCLFEQVIIAFILWIAGSIICSIGYRLFNGIFGILPTFVSEVIINTLGAVLWVFCVVAGIVILFHIFKTRYLDYYQKNTVKENKEETKTEEVKSSSKKENGKEEKIQFKENESKIVIRDPKHSEYRFIQGLFKIIILFIKFFALLFAFGVCFGLISLAVMFVTSFLVYKTGLFFFGLLLSILSCISIGSIILLLLLNFIFNRKNSKKFMILGFIGSVILFGIGCGMIAIGVVKFDFVTYDESMNKVVTIEHDMTDSLFIYPSYDNEIEYVEEDIPNIKIDYSINKYCDVEDWYNENDSSIHSAVSCKEPMKLVRETLKTINDKNIIYFDNVDEKKVVHASAENISRLQENWNRVLEERAREEEERNNYQNIIGELEQKNNDLNIRISELESELELYQHDEEKMD